MDIYLHGIETIESSNGPRPVETIDTGVIGLIFTAPFANTITWPFNKCIAIIGEFRFPASSDQVGLARMLSTRSSTRPLARRKPSSPCAWQMV